MPNPNDRIERKRVLLSPRSVWVNEKSRGRSPDSDELRLERSSKQRQLPMTPSGSLLSPGGGERKRASTPSVHPPAPDPTACLRRASDLPGGGGGGGRWGSSSADRRGSGASESPRAKKGAPPRSEEGKGEERSGSGRWCVWFLFVLFIFRRKEGFILIV